MINIINKMFSFLKVILLLAAFMITLYITMYMYYNLEKQPLGSDFMEFFANLLPYIILLVLFVINFVLRQKSVNNSIFYNLTCVIVFGAIIFMGYRALFDENMVLWHKTDYHINFEYFADQLSQIKVMVYGLIGANVLLMIEGFLSKEKKEKSKN